MVHKLLDGRVVFPGGFDVAAEDSVTVRLRFSDTATAAAASPSHQCLVFAGRKNSFELEEFEVGF